MSLYQLGIEGTIEEENICYLFLPTKVPVACIANNIGFLIYNCPRDGDNPSYGDQSEYGKHPVDGGCPKNCEVLRIWTILGMMTVLRIMTALGMSCYIVQCHIASNDDGIVNKTSLVLT